MIWSKLTSTPSFAETLPDILLSSDHIYMRPAQRSDWELWAHVRAENRKHLQPFEPRWPKKALEEEFFHRRLKRQKREWERDQANAFLIFEKDTNALIGGMNINNISRGAAQFCSLGYWIAKSYEGKGYMRQALRLTIRYCFEDLELHRINCSCLLHNTRSKNLLLRAGFTQEGLAKNYIQIDGKWQDHLLFGLPKESWTL